MQRVTSILFCFIGMPNSISIHIQTNHIQSNPIQHVADGIFNYLNASIVLWCLQIKEHLHIGIKLARLWPTCRCWCGRLCKSNALRIYMKQQRSRRRWQLLHHLVNTAFWYTQWRLVTLTIYKFTNNHKFQ